MPKRNCDHCRKVYEYEKPHSQFCSAACRQWFYRQNQKAAKTISQTAQTGEHFKAALVAIDALMEADIADISRHADDYHKLIDGIDNLFNRVQRAADKQRMS